MVPADNSLADTAPERPSCPTSTAADDSEWEAFFNATYPSLLRAAVLWGRSKEDAEDAVHMTMIYIRRHWSRIEHPRSYAHRVVINYVTTTQRRRREEIARCITSGAYFVDRYDDHALVEIDQQSWVHQLLDGLPPAQRAVMRGVYAGLSLAELAEHLGKDAATIRKNLQFARVRLRRQLHRQHDNDRTSGPEPHRRSTAGGNQ